MISTLDAVRAAAEAGYHGGASEIMEEVVARSI
jgi:hypothetical protein